MKTTIRIGDRTVGKGHPAYVIAEIGSNHDSDINKARDLIRAAAAAGADAFKMQSFTAQGLLNPLKPDERGEWVAHPAYPVIERLTVPEGWHAELKEFGKSIGITFLSAPFDSGRAELLKGLGMEAYKIASGDLTNEPLLRQIAGYNRPVILSTGASYLSEVRRAVEVLEGAGCGEIALLHCSSLYPPLYEEVNVRAMVTLKKEFGCAVGFSDHTPGNTVPIAAVTLGASIIEKHITLDRSAKGPDHPYAMEAAEFKAMVSEIRNLEKALGSGVKEPSKSEMAERVGARRSIYTTVDIHKGAKISPEMLKLVRHAYGLEPRDLNEVVGMTVTKDLRKDMPLHREDVCR